MNLFIRQRDAVGLSVYSDIVHTHTRSRTNISHHKNLLWQLESLAKPFTKDLKESTSSVEALHEISERINKRSLVILFSDLLSNKKTLKFLS